jgi:hypothetical protein
MNKLLLTTILLIATPVMADVYVVTAPDKSIYSLSEQNDAVVPSGYSVDIIKGKMIQDLMLGDDMTLYNYNGKKFTLDDKKVAKKNKDLQDASIAREANKAKKESAKAKLKAIGLDDSEIEAIIGGN